MALKTEAQHPQTYPPNIPPRQTPTREETPGKENGKRHEAEECGRATKRNKTMKKASHR